MLRWEKISERSNGSSCLIGPGIWMEVTDRFKHIQPNKAQQPLAMSVMLGTLSKRVPTRKALSRAR